MLAARYRSVGQGTAPRDFPNNGSFRRLLTFHRHPTAPSRPEVRPARPARAIPAHPTVTSRTFFWGGCSKGKGTIPMEGRRGHLGRFGASGQGPRNWRVALGSSQERLSSFARMSMRFSVDGQDGSSSAWLWTAEVRGHTMLLLTFRKPFQFDQFSEQK